MTGIGAAHSAAASGGMGDVSARIAAIQARIGGLTGPRVGQAPIGDAGDPAAAQATAFDLEAATTVATATRGPMTGVATTATATASTTPVRGPGPASVADATSASTTPATTTSAGAALAAKLPAHAKPWAGAITDAALKVGLDPTLLAALVQHESNFNPSVTSHAGAIGLAQLMPGTARGLGVDPHDPIQNLAGGARYLREQLDRFGSVDLALAAYNAGPNRVAQAGGVPRIAETTAYVSRVTATWEKLR